ncbi:PTS fructose IIA subunit, partial [Klebsiella pneumoniae]|nr:PTS fructose IIA subunit [Klebsiella pneumoniae]
TVCVVGKIRDLILQLSKSSIYSTKPLYITNTHSSMNELNEHIAGIGDSVIKNW